MLIIRVVKIVNNSSVVIFINFFDACWLKWNGDNDNDDVLCAASSWFPLQWTLRPQGCVAFSGESIGYDDESRLQNSPYFCVFKYTRAVKQKVWNEAENRERDLARDVSHVRLLRHALPISWLILRKKNRLFCSLWRKLIICTKSSNYFHFIVWTYLDTFFNQEGMYFQSREGTVTPGARVTHAKAPSCFNFKLAQLLDFIVEAGFISTMIDIDSQRITDSMNTPAE